MKADQTATVKPATVLAAVQTAKAKPVIVLAVAQIPKLAVKADRIPNSVEQAGQMPVCQKD